MTDPDLLSAALSATKLSARQFATDVLDVDEHSIQVWLSGKRPMLVAVRAICMTILERPTLIAEIVRARNASRQ